MDICLKKWAMALVPPPTPGDLSDTVQLLRPICTAVALKRKSLKRQNNNIKSRDIIEINTLQVQHR